MRDGMVATLIGIAIGVPLAFLAARALGVLLYGLSPADPLTFAATVGFFIALGLVGGMIPARRAARVDPLVALKAE